MNSGGEVNRGGDCKGGGTVNKRSILSLLVSILVNEWMHMSNSTQFKVKGTCVQFSSFAADYMIL